MFPKKKDDHCGQDKYLTESKSSEYEYECIHYLNYHPNMNTNTTIFGLKISAECE